MDFALLWLRTTSGRRMKYTSSSYGPRNWRRADRDFRPRQARPCTFLSTFSPSARGPSVTLLLGCRVYFLAGLCRGPNYSRRERVKRSSRRIHGPLAVPLIRSSDSERLLNFSSFSRPPSRWYFDRLFWSVEDARDDDLNDLPKGYRFFEERR